MDDLKLIIQRQNERIGELEAAAEYLQDEIVRLSHILADTSQIGDFCETCGYQKLEGICPHCQNMALAAQLEELQITHDAMFHYFFIHPGVN